MLARVRNSWLAVVVTILCFAPGALALSTGHHPDKDKKCGYNSDCKVAAAEGGSAGLYLLLAGASCLGAIRFKSRQQVQNVTF
jgi:hypothetical protein